MAEASALTSIAKSALQLFTSLARDEFLLLWHSREDLKKLKKTIEIISGFLLDAEERKSTDRSVQLCLSDLRKVMYDADDLFDALAFHLFRKKAATGDAFKKEVRLFFSKSNQLGFIVQTAHKVKSLRESLDEISKNMHQFSFIQQQQQPPLDPSFTRKKTHSFVHQEDIIGRDQEKVCVIDMLMGESSSVRSVSVAAIIGFGGFGKTALAQLVYNDEKVKQGFEVHLWACINYLSNLEQVLKEIIASKVGKTHLDLSLEMLQEKLRGIIGGKKFLIVLDDVWDENEGHWLDLETILRCGKNGSKVLVTTRSREVAKCLNASEPYFDLRGLSEESAWSLFVKRAFQGEELREHPELEPIGKKILSKCGNVPLAIVTVGGLLRQKRRDERTWTEFYDNKLKQVLSGGDGNSIKQVLMVSYNDLHPDLKLCFASCSLFPKDYEFDKDFLVRLWLAQGILKPCDDNEQSLEEVGESYFFHLVDRCFFQEAKYQLIGFAKYEYCGICKCSAKMHDLVHDMAIEVAKTENLFLDEVPVEKKEETYGLRHIAIAVVSVEDSVNCCSLVSNPKTVRTLLLTRCYEKYSQRSFELLVASFKMLRTLYLSGLGIDVIPESIGGLIHLRYLDLSWIGQLKCLPDSICKLHHLMVLSVEGCYLLEKLPRRIEKLVNLRQLVVWECDSLDCMPGGLKALTRLVNLDRLIVHPCDGGLRYLEGLDNLAGLLRIELPEEGWFEAVEDAEKSNMARKNKLNGMCIQWNQSPTVTAKMGKEEAKAVLEALRPHENLEYLRIDNYGGEMLSSWVFTLKYAKKLWLDGCDNVEYLEDGIKGGNMWLPSLKVLMIEKMKNLKGWWMPEIAQGTDWYHLSSVSSVSIKSCPKLKGKMPLFGGIECLQLSRVDAELLKELLVPNGFCESSFSPFYKNNRLKELDLLRIRGLIELPERCIWHLTALERLTIQKCRKLRRVSRRGLANLTALKQLEIGCCEIGDEDDIEDDKMGIREEAGKPWKALQGLEILKVEVGDSHLLDGLEYLTFLRNLRIHKWKDARLQVVLPFTALQNLDRLSIGFGQETFDLTKSGIQHLHSLNELTIEDCKELYLSWKTLLNMKKLGSLVLERVERVVDVEYDTMMVEPRCLLSYLQIEDVAGAEWIYDIPWIFLSSSLESLRIWGMGERENLPDGIQHLSSLQTLEIGGCEEVRSLPVWIPKLTSLRHLRIYDCSVELKRRCEKGTGDDWPLICHLLENHILAASENQSGSDNESMEEEE